MVGVAPLTTHRPWATSRTTSFGARVLSVSFVLVQLVSASNVPSAAVGKSRLLVRPGPHAFDRTPSPPTGPII